MISEQHVQQFVRKRPVNPIFNFRRASWILLDHEQTTIDAAALA